MIKKFVNEIKYKKLVWFTELLIWIILLLLISTTIVICKYNYKKDFNTYQIFLQDVDGLIVGSPVKMMGVQVGYVNQINMVDDIVYIKFIITKKGLKIPKGSVVTVEFSGLGGSRSLEIYTHQHNNSNEILIAQSPTRLGQAVGMLYTIFNKIGNISYRITTFSKTVEEILPKNSTAEVNLNKSIKEADKWIDKTQKKEEKLNKKLKEWNDE